MYMLHDVHFTIKKGKFIKFDEPFLLFQHVYCGHEYALQNLRFGAHVEPDNPSIRAKISWVQQRRDEGLPSVPSTIGEYYLYCAVLE